MLTEETKRIWRNRRDGQLAGLTVLVFTPAAAFFASHWGAHGDPPIPRDRAFWTIVIGAEALGVLKLVWSCRCPVCDGFVWPLQDHERCGRCKQEFDASEIEQK